MVRACIIIFLVLLFNTQMWLIIVQLQHQLPSQRLLNVKKTAFPGYKLVKKVSKQGRVANELISTVKCLHCV